MKKNKEKEITEGRTNDTFRTTENPRIRIIRTIVSVRH